MICYNVLESQNFSTKQSRNTVIEDVVFWANCLIMKEQEQEQEQVCARKHILLATQRRAVSRAPDHHQTHRGISETSQFMITPIIGHFMHIKYWMKKKIFPNRLFVAFSTNFLAKISFFKLFWDLDDLIFSPQNRQWSWFLILNIHPDFHLALGTHTLCRGQARGPVTSTQRQLEALLSWEDKTCIY